MHLKKLEISGFKSFANKTVFEFNKQITAVVGPNGSGKSNIADAVRWALGEQGLKGLRTKTSEDLIFAGSNKKARLGAAQVFLYLNNESGELKEYPEEIVIGRKFFRNGESEYYVNNKKTRLRDITHLAAQVGAGARSYAVITQGLADAILNTTPRDRRAIFEEAAGVKLFQLKKEETLRKLGSTKTNLIRIGDLLREILPHLKFLERQAKKAQKRQVLEKELREKQVIFYSFKRDYLEKEIVNIKNDKNSTKEIILRLTEELETCKKELNEENETTGQKEKEEIDLEDKLNTLQEDRNSLTRDIALIEGKIEVLKQYSTNEGFSGRVFQKEDVRYYDEINVDLNDAKEKLKDILNSYKSLSEKVLLAKDIQELSAIKKEFGIIGKKIESLYEKFDTRNKPIEEKPVVEKNNVKKIQTDELDKLIKQKDELQIKLNNIIQEANDARLTLQKIKEIERDNRKKFFDIERKIRLNEDQILLKESRIKDIESQEERLNIRREELIREINEYQIELTVPDGKIDENKTEMEIMRIRRQLEEIGGIDEMALKEYQETNDRYNFLQKEKDDLEKAADDLREAVAVLDGKINRQFNEKFSEINDEFNKYFKMIFGGGKASLKKFKEVSRKRNTDGDENDPIKEEDTEDTDTDINKSNEVEAIDVKVSLPNKKIDSINVMSGGERALTSIAILFAIIGANPPPFCVLDEVDAALDDANAYRFSKILEDLTNRTQFIIITHNRETMHAAKILYGITMEEEGISKLVSVSVEK